MNNNCTYSGISKDYLGKTVKHFFTKAAKAEETRTTEQYVLVRLCISRFQAKANCSLSSFLPKSGYLTKLFKVIRWMRNMPLLHKAYTSCVATLPSIRLWITPTNFFLKHGKSPMTFVEIEMSRVHVFVRKWWGYWTFEQ